MRLIVRKRERERKREKAKDEDAGAFNGSLINHLIAI